MFDNFSDMFRGRSHRAQEQQEYARWAFPYGQAQKKLIQELLEKLFPVFDESMRLFYYLTAKEVMGDHKAQYLSPESREEAIRGIIKELKRGGFQPVKNADRAAYCALAQLEWDLTPELIYPDPEQVRSLAAEIGAEFEKVRKKKKCFVRGFSYAKHNSSAD